VSAERWQLHGRIGERTSLVQPDSERKPYRKQAHRGTHTHADRTRMKARSTGCHVVHFTDTCTSQTRALHRHLPKPSSVN
jgi:hypothetical protein